MKDSLKLISSDVIADSGVAFGTSGARGLVNQFTADVCGAFTAAFVKRVKNEFDFSTIAIAIDNRPSSYKMAQFCASILEQLQVNVIYYGVVPTPALAYLAQIDKIPAIMVTGSHIPFDRNGLKFYRPDGEITKADENFIIREKVKFSKVNELIDLKINNRAAEEYILRYTSLFKSPWLKGKRIGIYEHSSAGRDLYSRIFEKLGAEVISLGRSDQFVPIDTEAVSDEDKLKAIYWSKEHNLDVVFSTDGDGDRPLVSDENGHWLRGDVLGTITSDVLAIEAIAVPVSCNTSVELCNKFIYVSRTKIGSPYVIAEFDKLAKKYSSFAGFEANGGYLLGSDIKFNGSLLNALPTRDAVLPVIMLLYASKTMSISNLVKRLPQRYTHSDRIQGFATEKSKAIIEMTLISPQKLIDSIGFKDVTIMNVDETDGVRLILSSNQIIHLRPSGNAPELRCYCESDNALDAEFLVKVVLDKFYEISLSNFPE